ncbi:MAG: 6 kDa early secretory antigenic target, partial [Pseudonocardiales bacterium]|nr:6 kDa early secretory antigenic target [Pseudonocardiales bacterium]
MSGDVVQVSFADLQNAAGSISSSAQQVQQQLDDLRTNVQKVMGGYTGAAAEAYQVKQQQWDRSAADL